LIRQALRRNQQDIHLVPRDGGLDLLPLIHVVGVDRLGPNAHALRGLELIAHEGQQWRDQEGRPVASLAHQSRGDEIDEALAPAGVLNDEQPPPALDDVADRVFLAGPEGGLRLVAALT
jgi:hypothetical protein